VSPQKSTAVSSRSLTFAGKSRGQYAFFDRLVVSFAYSIETEGKTMSTQNPGFWLRFMLAFRYFFIVLVNAEFARRVAALESDQTTPQPQTAAPEPQAPPRPTAPPVSTAPPEKDPSEPVLQFLGLLQQEARFIDFIQEDVTQFRDADIGAAARVVHSGCKKIIQQYMSLAPVRSEQEQTRVTLADEFDPAEVRLTGRVSGQGPFSGVLMHRGWKVTRIELPKLASGHNAHVLAPAEVEI
jgi:hypothetical protein